MIVPATLVIIHLVIYVRPGVPSSSHFTLHFRMLSTMLLTGSNVDSSSFYVGFREVFHSGCNAVMLIPVTLLTNSFIAHRCYSQCDQALCVPLQHRSQRHFGHGLEHQILELTSCGENLQTSLLLFNVRKGSSCKPQASSLTFDSRETAQGYKETTSIKKKSAI